MPYSNTNSIKLQTKSPTVKTIDFEDAVKNFRQLFKKVNQKDDQYIIRDNGQALVVLLPFADWRNLTQSKERSKKRFFEMVDELREYNKDVPYEQIEKDVTQAVAEVRQEELERLKNQ